jgi:LemA protein
MRSRGAIAAVVVVLVVLAAGCGACGTYNSLVEEDESVRRFWADVQTQYQRRSDLIPNLVQTVQGAADFEQETLTSVTDARARATSINISAADLGNPAAVRQFMEAQSDLGQSLGRLLAVAENYPQVRSTEAFRDLQAQLEGTENRIAVARRDYNGAVQSYNTRLRSFPTNLLAGAFGFDSRTPFEAADGAQEVPAVEFN